MILKFSDCAINLAFYSECIKKSKFFEISDTTVTEMRNLIFDLLFIWYFIVNGALN
jgi:hypothetical protein